MEVLFTTGASVLAIVLAIAVLGFVALKFYTLASKEISFVRTGAGSQKVVLNGGAFVIPAIHEIIRVNMKTLRLEIEKKETESLITADRLRVDVKVDFYVRVAATEESIAAAAQTLGDLTLNPSALKNQVEAKFVDALRSVAVGMKMYDLNAHRTQFVEEVQKVVAKDIAKNGLELESVSLTSLNQTNKKFFDPTNAFDAEGLLVLTRETQARIKTVNDIEQDTAVQIGQKNLDTERQQQALTKQTEEVRLTTTRDIATMTAETQAATAASEAEARRKAESAAIEAEQSIQSSRIEAARANSEAQVTADAQVQMRKQETAITVANKSKDVAAADEQAAKAAATAVAAQESIETARQVEVANRSKQVTIVAAEEAAEKAAVAIRVASAADKDAATNRADALRVTSEGVKDAAVNEAEAIRSKGEAEAAALQARNDAANSLSVEQIGLQIRLAVLQALPGIVAQAVKPLENIESIRIAEVGGLGGATNGGNGTSTGSSTGGSLSDQVVNSALRYRTNAPMVDALLKEVGLAGAGNLSELVASAAGVGMASTDVVLTPDAVVEPVAPTGAGDTRQD